MEEQNVITPSLQKHSHTGLYTTIALSLGTATVLMIIVLALLIKKPTASTIPTHTTYPYTQQYTQTAPSSIQNQIQQITPTPIQNNQGLQAIAQQLDTANMTQITTSLDQNSQDVSSFSQ